MSEEPKIFKVIHKTWRGDGREHTYNESFIKVIKGVANCHTEQAAKVLVNMRGYMWLDPKDEEGTPENELKKKKEATVAARLGKAITAAGKEAGKAIKNAASSKRGKGKGKKEESPKASESAEE